MSLTRNQWEVMWESVKRIEKINSKFERFNLIAARDIQAELRLIKQLIETVVGQME